MNHITVVCSVIRYYFSIEPSGIMEKMTVKFDCYITHRWTCKYFNPSFKTELNIQPFHRLIRNRNRFKVNMEIILFCSNIIKCFQNVSDEDSKSSSISQSDSISKRNFSSCNYSILKTDVQLSCSLLWMKFFREEVHQRWGRGRVRAWREGRHRWLFRGCERPDSRFRRRGHSLHEDIGERSDLVPTAEAGENHETLLGRSTQIAWIESLFSLWLA